MLWIPITVLATGLQVGRNALQRGLLADAGPWGASLVRFLFGLPFSLLFVAVAWWVTPGVRPHFSLDFFLACAIGGTRFDAPIVLRTRDGISAKRYSVGGDLWACRG
jgi:hypothetical protein